MSEPRWHEMTYTEIGALFRDLTADRDRWKNVVELAMQARFDDVWGHVEEAYEWAVRGE